LNLQWEADGLLSDDSTASNGGRDLRMLTIIVAFETLSVDRAQKLQGRC
jgi:hypothetical protein